MKAGATLSFVGHAVLLTWGLFSVAPNPLEDEFVEALPVEFVTISEVTDLTKGVETATEVIESEETTETPDVATEEVSENPGPAEKPVETPDPTPVEEVAREAVPAPQPETPPTPDPVPEPPKPEPVADPVPPQPKPVEPPKPIEEIIEEAKEPEPPKPVEVARAPDAAALEELLEEELKKPEEKIEPEKPKVEAPKPPSVPVPRLNPKPLKERQRQVAAVDPQKLLNKRDPSNNASGKPKKKTSVGTKQGRLGAKLTQTELDGLRRAIQACWALPQGYTAGREFRAKVKAKLSRNGEIAGKVQVVSVIGYEGGPPILIRKAVRDAITGCAPYKLPAQKYARWKDLEVTFYP